MYVMPKEKVLTKCELAIKCFINEDKRYLKCKWYALKLKRVCASLYHHLVVVMIGNKIEIESFFPAIERFQLSE